MVDYPVNYKTQPKLEEHQIIELCERYQCGENGPQLASVYGISTTAIYGLLRRRNIDRRTSIITSQNDIFNIISLYYNNLTCKQIGEIYNVSWSTINKILHRYHVSLKKPHEFRKYGVDQSYFEQINSEGKAYDLGWLYADGYVFCNKRLNKYYISISLAIKDKVVLEHFKNRLKSNYPIVEYEVVLKSNGKKYQACRLCISSKKMVHDLINLGCGQAKTNTIRWPNNIVVPAHLKHHFARGYVDGDGSFFIDKDNQPNFSVVSNHEFCNEMEKWLIQRCDINQTKLWPAPGTFLIHHGGRINVLKIANVLYDNASIWLDRKRDIIKPYFNRHGRQKLSQCDEQKIIKEYVSNKCTAELCFDNNIDVSTMYSVLHKNNINLRGRIDI